VSARQLRLVACGFGLRLNPVALAALDEFERGHVYAVLRLDAEQEAVAEAAVAAVLAGTCSAPRGRR
jgi:hypothetical protein